MKSYRSQICIIAAGPSGLAAAVQAAEDGAEVIVLEKAAIVGGAANMGMGPLGIGTKTIICFYCREILWAMRLIPDASPVWKRQNM